MFTWRTAAAAGVAAATCAGTAALVPNGWGWVTALGVPGRVHHPWDLATVLGLILTLRVGRIVALAAGAVIVALLVWRAAAKARAAATGGALETVAFTAPAVHPWYAVWGLALVAATATARARWWMVGVSVALCATTVPDPLPRYPLARIGLLAALLAGGLVAARRRGRAVGWPGDLPVGLPDLRPHVREPQPDAHLRAAR